MSTRKGKPYIVREFSKFQPLLFIPSLSRH